MRIRRVQVAQLRRFYQPVVLDDLGEGINLFTGPNESGKSTLVRALRAAFLERHRSTTVRDLLPWADSAAAPEITVHFEAAGRSWQLTKRFLRQARCDLRVDGERYTGDEAEEQLARLLGYALPGRGPSRPEHQGVPGLLWTEQGDGHHIRQPVMHAGDWLKAVLGSSLGEVASSGGDGLLEEVARRRGELLTATGRPTGALRKIEQQREELSSRLTALQQQVGEYRQQVDGLHRLRQRHRRLQAERPWEGFLQQAREASERLQAVAALEREQERERRELERCRQALRHIQSRVAGLRQRAQERVRRREELAAAEQRLAALEALQPGLEERLEEARRRRDRLDSEYKQQLRARRHRELLQQQEELTADLASRRRQLEQARQLAGEQARLQQQLADLAVDPDGLQALRRLETARTELAIRRQTVATRLHYELEPDQRLRLGEVELQGRGEVQLLQPESLYLEGVGRLRILPGGSDVEDLDRQQRSLDEERGRLLRELGVSSLDQAETSQHRAETLQQALQQIRSSLSVLAPAGVEALAGELDRLAQRRSRGAEELAALTDVSEPAMEPGGLAQLEGALSQAEEALVAAAREEREARVELVRAGQTVVGARSEHDRLMAEENAPERREQESELQQQLALATADQERLEQALARRQQDIDGARPELLQQDVERLEASAAAARGEAEQCQRELDRLQATLETRGAEGLEEEAAELKARLDHVERRRRQLRRRAEALDLLQQRLQHHRRELTRQLQAPLQRHLNHYLHILFPGARLTVDEDLVPEQLLRTGLSQDSEPGDYDALSFGAREQMGLISRLAYADLLKEAGRPTLLILDDALVHSDGERLGQMKRVLYDAARRHQILLFTCHPDSWQGLGVEARSLVGLSEEAG